MAEEEKQGQNPAEEAAKVSPNGEGVSLAPEETVDAQEEVPQEQTPPDPEELLESLTVEEDDEGDSPEAPLPLEDQEESPDPQEGEDLSQAPLTDGPTQEETPEEESIDQGPEGKEDLSGQGFLEREDTKGEAPLEGVEEGAPGPEEPEGQGPEGSSSDDSPPPDDLLASLLDEAEEEEAEEEKPQVQEGQKADSKPEDQEAPRSKVFWILFASGLLLILGLLGTGVVVLWRLWQAPLTPPPKPPVSQTSKPKAEAPLVVAPIVPERKLLILDNFLIPYQRETGEYVFVKAKALLYFGNDKNFVQVQKDLTLWREQVFQVLKNIPLYVWENRKGEEVVRKQLLSYLKKVHPDGIIPVDLEVTGYILK